MSVITLAGLAWSQERPVLAAEPRPELPAGLDLTALAMRAGSLEQVLYDEPGDGALWARGASYKARFDQRGASIVPFFGSQAPRNFPVTFELAAAELGDEPLAFLAQESARRDGHIVRIDRGSFIEEYELGLHSLEQRFVFAGLPRSGELSVRLGIETEHALAQNGQGLRFANEYGHLDYSEAFALDAAGRRISIPTVLVDGGLELRVPADFVASATFPLVIDPIITVFSMDGTGYDNFKPDVSYDVTTDRWCVVWVNIFSASDYDVYARLLTGSGFEISTLVIDFTTWSWDTPRVANNNGWDVFLIVASASASGVSYIRGRIVTPATSTVGDVLLIGPGDGAYRNLPDVGGDSYTGTASYFCVVWQRVQTANWIDIESRVVSPSGALGDLRTLNTGGGINEYPRISNAAGTPDTTGTEAWTVVWQRRATTTNNDIYGAQLAWGGWIVQPMFPIDTSPWNETRPVVATMLDATGPGIPRPYLVVHERDYGDHDVIGVVLHGASIQNIKNLVGDFDPSFWYRDQRSPAVDSDGKKFLVGFDERDTPGGSNPDLYMCSYSFTGGGLIACELHESFASSSGSESEIALHSMASSAGPGSRFFGTWNHISTTGNLNVHGGLWDACPSATGVVFCSGDGSGAACPCANPGVSGRGCRNSSSAGGAGLAASGLPSVGSDSVVLVATNSTPFQPGLFFQGDNATNGGGGAVFGDGLRCAGGNVQRLQLRTANASGSAQSDVSISASAGLSAGEVKRYQWWYRDPTASPCGFQFNLSNGIELTWLP